MKVLSGLRNVKRETSCKPLNSIADKLTIAAIFFHQLRHEVLTIFLQPIVHDRAGIGEHETAIASRCTMAGPN